MSSPNARPLADGKIFGTIYDFAQAGDELPLHVHGEIDKHYTFVQRGRIKVFGPWGEQIAEAGAILRFPAGKEHGFIALEDNSRISNIRY